MDTFVTIIGWLAVTGLCVAVAAIVCTLALSVFGAVLDKLESQGRQAERARIYEQLRHGSYWFSEDPATSELFKIYADKVVRQSEGGVHEIREEWREFRRKQPIPIVSQSH